MDRLREDLRTLGARLTSIGDGRPRPGHGTDAVRSGWRLGLWHGSILSGLLVLAYTFLVVAPREGIFGMDAWAYWSVHRPDVYAVPLSHLGAFPYSPPAAMVADLFDIVPWNTFICLWTALLVATVIFIGGRGAWVLAAFAFPTRRLRAPLRQHPHRAGRRRGAGVPPSLDVVLRSADQVHLRHRAPLVPRPPRVAKPGAGPRADCRDLCRDGSAGSLAVGRLAGVPRGLAQVFDEAGSLPIPLWPRLIAAAALVVWGARTDRRWTVVAAATVALPVLWIAGLAMLIGIIPEVRGRSLARTARPSTAVAAARAGA